MKNDTARFINRDLSWLDFNARVLAEGLRKDLPPLDRFRFMSIVSSNLDEFYMVRLAAMKRALRAGIGAAADPAGLGPEAQIRAASEKVRALINEQYSCLLEEVFPALEAGGLELVRPEQYSLADIDFLESFFMREIFPVLTPLRFDSNSDDDSGASQAISGISIHAAFLLANAGNGGAGNDDSGNDDSGNSNAGVFYDGAVRDAAAAVDDPASARTERIAIIRIPRALSRIVKLPAMETETPGGSTRLRWALLDDLVLSWGAWFFPGYAVEESLLFKITRDADFSVDEKRDEDFVEAMEEVLERRDHSRVVRLVHTGESRKLRDELARRFGLEEGDLFTVDSPLDLPTLASLADAPGFDHLRGAGRKIYPLMDFPADENIWDRIKAGDVMLHLPYQSFDPVLRFFRDAAADPRVIAIKTALYRTSGDSPIVHALEAAALAGKHVTALVELKARFDEARNIAWANRLEKAGVIVVYGLARLKVHAKVSLVIRREDEGLKRYVHLSTGNYNDRTAALYGDIGIFTAREDIVFDAGLLFNTLTGYSSIGEMRSISVAPAGLKRRLVELINREAERARSGMPGRIMAKMNSLADQDVITALYAASSAGVRISLNVRGICMLVPGVPELSEHIEVVSVIDRYLEHARIFFFANAGDGEVYLSSADWMPRNLERRVELMFPVIQQNIRDEARDILEAYFRDNRQAWELGADARWRRREPAPGEAFFTAQEYFLRKAAKAAEVFLSAHEEFTVRRSAPTGSMPDPAPGNMPG
ncbi:MAG: polyphosphate kinase 1 [Spirochaetaceae bacterium]|jgi:polyphosphate kinase|nr:polyphosphate kinase 1 [Spirochaetaceae bacterium]